jgi:hypothetical protein
LSHRLTWPVTVILGIRPERVTLAGDTHQLPAIDADTLFLEPMGADTLGWFQCNEHRIAAGYD